MSKQITFKEITPDCIWVIRNQDLVNPVAVILRHGRGWHLVGDGRTLATGQMRDVQRTAVDRYCTCDECLAEIRREAHADAQFPEIRD